MLRCRLLDRECRAPVSQLLAMTVIDRDITPQLLVGMDNDPSRVLASMPAPAAAAAAAARGDQPPQLWWQAVLQGCVDDRSAAAESETERMCISKVRAFLQRGHMADLSYSAQVDRAAGDRGKKLPRRFCLDMVAGGGCTECAGIAQKLAAVTSLQRQLGMETAAGLQQDLLPAGTCSERNLARDYPWPQGVKAAACTPRKKGQRTAWRVQAFALATEHSLHKTKSILGQVDEHSLAVVLGDLVRMCSLWEEDPKMLPEMVAGGGARQRRTVDKWNHPPEIWFSSAEGFACWKARAERLHSLRVAAYSLRMQLRAALQLAFANENCALLSVVVVVSTEACSCVSGRCHVAAFCA